MSRHGLAFGTILIPWRIHPKPGGGWFAILRTGSCHRWRRDSSWPAYLLLILGRSSVRLPTPDHAIPCSFYGKKKNKTKPCTALLPTFLSRVWFRFQLGSSNSCLLISPSPDHWLRAVPSSNLFFPRHHSFPNRVSSWLFIIIISTSLCSISVPWPGIEPAYPAMEAQSPNHWTARAVPSQLFSKPTSMGTAPPRLGPCDGDHQALLIGRHTAGGRLREGLEHKLLPETSVPRKQEKRSYTYVSITLAPQKPRGGLQWFLPPSPYRK